MPSNDNQDGSGCGFGVLLVAFLILAIIVFIINMDAIKH